MPSTTVVVVKLHVVCSANMARSLGANGARQTRRARAPRVAAWTAQDTKSGAASPGHATAHQAARRRGGGQTAPRGALRHFFHGGGAGTCPARSTVNSAEAHMAKGRCRYPPVQCRTAYGSSPTSPVASSQHRAMVHRRPPTCTTVARVVGSGAHPTDAGRSVGALRLRRTTSHRRPWGGPGAVNGRHRPASPRGPLVPSPVCHRPQPASSPIARRVLPCHWRPARQPSAWPETVRPYAWGRSAHHARSGRFSPATLSPATQAAGPGASNARASRGRARGGVGAKGRAGGMPARSQRPTSSVHAWGRDSSRASTTWP